MVLIWLGNKGFLVCLTVGGVTVLCLWATLSTAKYWFNQGRLVQHNWKNVDCDVKNQEKQKLHICFSAPTLKLNLKFSFIFLRFAQLTWAIDICWLSSVSTAELLVSLIQQSWIFQTDRIPSTHWALDICRLSNAFVAELLVSLIQQAWIFQTDRIPSTYWALDICRLSSAFLAELLVSLIQQAWVFQTDRIASSHLGPRHMQVV